MVVQSINFHCHTKITVMSTQKYNFCDYNRGFDKKIYDEGELTADSTCAFFAQVQTEGKRQVERKILIYNLDMIKGVSFLNFRHILFLER